MLNISIVMQAICLALPYLCNYARAKCLVYPSSEGTQCIFSCFVCLLTLLSMTAVG